MPADEAPAPESRGRAVLDPQWEAALRAGQHADGDHGSVEDELAVIHLLRHARAPQPLEEPALQRAWQQIDADLRGPAQTGWRGWLRRPWLLGGGVAMAAAAAVLVVVIPSDPAPRVAGPDPLGEPASLPAGGSASMAATIEAQFAVLEPAARSALERSVEDDRSRLRGDLLAAARATQGRSGGGAP